MYGLCRRGAWGCTSVVRWPWGWLVGVMLAFGCGPGEGSGGVVRDAAASDGQVEDGARPGVDGGDDGGDDGGASGMDGGPPVDPDAGWTLLEPDETSRVIYVSVEGDDGADGLSAEAAVRTLARGAELVRDGHYDFLLLRRGDAWSESLGRFKSGRDADHPLVVASYGEGPRPLLEHDGPVINHDGRERSYLALLDLHFRPAGKVPPGNGLDIGPSVRFVGGGEHLLVEGCHFEYTELVVQSCCERSYRDVRVRRNVFERSYQPNLCVDGDLNGSNRVRPSGMFTAQVERLTLEENVFDHNGHNRDRVPSACATIYNHNVYLTRSTDLRVTGNLFARASSIHIKLTGDVDGPTNGWVVEDNYFTGGEIAIGAGGNSEGADRFQRGRVRDNVLEDIGVDPPTRRSLAWGIELTENRDTLVERNLFVAEHPRTLGNSYALQLTSRANADIRIVDNVFFRIPSRMFWARAGGAHSGIEILGNTFVDPGLGACLVGQDEGFVGYTYRDNRYFSQGDGGAHCEGSARRSFVEWVERSAETGAVALDDIPFVDAERSLARYAATLGLPASLEAYLEAARAQRRGRWRPELGASAINRYMRAGFERR